MMYILYCCLELLSCIHSVHIDNVQVTSLFCFHSLSFYHVNCNSSFRFLLVVLKVSTFKVGGMLRPTKERQREGVPLTAPGCAPPLGQARKPSVTSQHRPCLERISRLDFI